MSKAALSDDEKNRLVCRLLQHVIQPSQSARLGGDVNRGRMQKVMLPALLWLAVIVWLSANLVHAAPPRLIMRGDDMGAAHGVNVAILKCHREGIQTSIEVLVPAPWFPEAAAMLANELKADIGVHLTLTSEWDNIKWRPLTAAVSLRDADGYFYPMLHPNKNYPRRALAEHDWQLADIEAEFRAQIELAKQRLPRVTHLSGHMGCDQLSPEVQQLVKRLAREYQLDIWPDEHAVKGISYSGKHGTADEKLESFIKTLTMLADDTTYLFVEHPGLDTPELRAIHHVGYENVAADRQGVTDLWTNPRVRQQIAARGIQLIGYGDLKSE